MGSMLPYIAYMDPMGLTIVIIYHKPSNSATKISAAILGRSLGSRWAGLDGSSSNFNAYILLNYRNP